MKQNLTALIYHSAYYAGFGFRIQCIYYNDNAVLFFLACFLFLISFFDFPNCLIAELRSLGDRLVSRRSVRRCRVDLHCRCSRIYICMDTFVLILVLGQRRIFRQLPFLSYAASMSETFTPSFRDDVFRTSTSRDVSSTLRRNFKSTAQNITK